MAGCGGNCSCGRAQQGSSAENAPRDRVALVDAIAKVVVEGRVARRAVSLYSTGDYSQDEAVMVATAQINLENEHAESL